MSGKTTGKTSAGLLLYRFRGGELEVLLAHPGGPFFAHKDEEAWGVPKGLAEPGEDLEVCARRELTEETGLCAEGPLLPLGHVRQVNGKTVHAWACLGDFPPGFRPHSNHFEMEWPRGSGQMRSFPEVDRAEFFPVAVALHKLTPAQRPFLTRLLEGLAKRS